MRGKHFILDGEFTTLDFGTYSLLLYYAMKLNYGKAKKMFDSTLTEWQYRVYNDLPRGSFDHNNTEAHIVIDDIQEVVQFIDEELIPALSNETQDLLVKYGGKSKLADTINRSTDFIGELGLADDEFYYDDQIALVDISGKLKNIYQAVLQGDDLKVDVY